VRSFSFSAVVDVRGTRLLNPFSKPFLPPAASPTFSKKCSTTWRGTTNSRLQWLQMMRSWRSTVSLFV
jgi:hypothetical protein